MATKYLELQAPVVSCILHPLFLYDTSWTLPPTASRSRSSGTIRLERPATFAAVPGSWENSSEAYRRSYAHLCAGTVAEILTQLGPADHAALLLDVGTGPGTVAKAAHDAGYVTVGMDNDFSMISSAAAHHSQIALAMAALPQLPCRDQTFDAVTANFVLNHTADPLLAAGELHRVIKQGGRLVATIWPARVLALNRLWTDVMQHAVVTAPPLARLSPELDFGRTPQGFTGLLHRAGFTQIECRYISWIFEIHREHLWTAVEAGIAVIGQTYLAQPPAGRRRMRASYDDIVSARHVGSFLTLPSTALIATAHRLPGRGHT